MMPPGTALGRIVVVYAGYPHRGGGVSQHLRQLAASLPALGYDLEIVGLDRVGPLVRFLPHVVQKAGNAVNPPSGFYARYRTGRRLFRPIVEAHVRTPGTKAVIFEDIFTAFAVPAPSLAVLHALQSHNLHGIAVGDAALQRGRRLEARCLDQAPCPFVTVSEPYRQWIDRDLAPYTSAARSLPVVPLGIDMTPFPWPLRPRPRSRLEIVFAGYLEARKNLRFLSSLLVELARQAPGAFRLTIVGDGPLRGQLERWFAADGVSHLVRFVGRVPHADIPAILQECHVMVHPSLAESFAFTLLEGRLCGLWTICPEGLAVPADFCDASLPFDARLWAEHIADRFDGLLQPPSRRRSDGVLALRDGFSALRMARTYLEMLGLPVHERGAVLQSS